MRDEGHHAQGRFGTRTKWRLVVNPAPADRRAQWGHRCHQSQVTLGWRGPISHHEKQDRPPPHADSLADVVAEEAAKRLLLVLNLERKAKMAERIGIGVAKRGGNMQKVCHWEAGGRTGSARPFARSSQQGLEMFLEPNSLCPAAMRGRSHLPLQKQEKTAQRAHRRFGLRQVCFPFCRRLCNQRANKSTRNI